MPMAKQLVIRGAYASLVTAIAALMMGATAPTSAEHVPVPKPAPKSRNIHLSAAAGPMMAGAAQQQQQQQPSTPRKRRKPPR
jgi:hypothetical protein